MRLFMGVSQAIRDTLILILGMAIVVQCSVLHWLADEATIKKMEGDG